MKSKVAILGSLISAVLVVGCGGSSSISTVGKVGGGTSSTAQMTVSIALPSGVSSPAGGLRLSGGLFDPVGASGTTARITGPTASRELVAAIDTSGRPILLGFLGNGHTTLNADSTTVALAYFAMCGSLSPYQNREAVIESIEASVLLPTGDASITTTLQQNGNLSSASAPYRSVIATLADTLSENTSATLPPNARLASVPQTLTDSGKATAHSVTLSPTNTAQSGVVLQYGSLENQVFATNSFRRRVLCFIDQVSTVDSGGTITPAPLSIGSFEMSPAQGMSSSLNLIANLGGLDATVTSATQTLPTLSSSLSAANYVVTAAGSGSSTGSSVTLTVAEQSQLTAFNQASFVKDYFLPIFNDMLAIASSPVQANQVPVYQSLELAVDNNSAPVQALVGASFPTASQQAANGNFQGAYSSVLAGLKDPVLSGQMVKLYGTIASSAGIGSSTTGRLSTILGWLNQVLSGSVSSSFNLPQFVDSVNSHNFDTWKVQVNNYKVKLSPAAGAVSNTIAADLTTPFTVSVNPSILPTGSSFVYSWSTPGALGDLTISTGTTTTSTGTNFPNSTDPSVVYGATTGLTSAVGTENVTCEVGIKDSQGNITKVGSASAPVTVTGDSTVKLLPGDISVKPNSTSQSVTVTTSSIVVSNTYLWSLSPATLGTLNVGSTATTQTSVNVAAGGTQQVGTLTCTALDASGKTIGTASVKVHVEQQPTIVYGSVACGVHYSSDGTRLYWGIWVDFPLVPNAKTVSMSCYNFYDPAYWQRSVTASGTYSNGAWNWSGGDDISADASDEGPAGTHGALFEGLTGGSGPAGSNAGSDLGGIQSYENQRFSGMIVKATYSY